MTAYQRYNPLPSFQKRRRNVQPGQHYLKLGLILIYSHQVLRTVAVDRHA